MKNNDVIEYKGYYTHVEYSAEDKVLHGKIEGIRDLVNFECENAADVEKEFQEAVDDYLAFCEDVGKEPDKPYSGVFNVRISPELHRSAAMAADRRGIKLNAFVKEAVERAVESKQNESQTFFFLSEKLLSKYTETAIIRAEARDVSYGKR